MRSASRALRARLGEPHAYELVLALVALAIVVEVALPDGRGSRLVTIALQGAILLTALWVSRARAGLIRAALALVALALLAALAAYAGVGEGTPLVARIAGALLAGLAPLALAAGVVRHLRQDPAVRVPTVAGVLTIYLLIGMSFAYAYAAVDAAEGEALFISLHAPSRSDFLYFSYVTLTTVGYGDLVPATDVGRAFAIAEALIGQIYLVTVVALIIGNLGGRARASARSS